jgi:hypothetical protein
MRLREFGLAGVAFLVTLLLSEVLLRLLGVSYPVFTRTDPVRGASHIPGAKGWQSREGHAWVEINSAGLRGPEVAVRQPAGTFRVALLGDSFIEAVQVPFENTLGEVLERRLSELRGRPVEVLNFGVGGYGTSQQLLTLQHEVWKYSPDLVLLAVTTGNDVSDNYRSLKRVGYVPYHVFRDGKLVLDDSFLKSGEYLSRNTWTSRMLQRLVQQSRLAQLVNDARYAWRLGRRQQDRAAAGPDELGLSENIYLPPAPNSDWSEAWKVTEGVLRLMLAESRRNNTPFVLVTLSNGIQVDPVSQQRDQLLRRLGVSDLFYPERRLAALGKEAGIPVLNLAPTMARHAADKRVFFHGFDDRLGRGHWNESGHQFAGEAIASWIAGRPEPKGAMN